jgi:hypothetical protein
MKIAYHVIGLLLLGTAGKIQAPKAVQFNIGKILNARPVTTLANQKLTTWTRGIDGNGAGDGYLTYSAAIFNGDKNPHALPDDPLISGDSSHPEILLHYNNPDSLNMQAHSFKGEDSVMFNVPKKKYKAVYLALTSAEGASNLHIRLTYTSDCVSQDFVEPDYYADLAPKDTGLCYLVHNLAKWGNKNNMTENDHHNIDLLKIPANPVWKLKSISISKTKPGYLVLWAAAGVKAD